jgi:cobalt-zinc-cadmium efflux system outer membrane protein
MVNNNKTLLIIIAFFFLGKSSFSQTSATLTLTLQQAESLFLQENYQLISQRFETDQANAEIITAKLFNNPEISYENQFFNNDTKKFFQTSRAQGQYAAEISQVIRLAGKRNKNILLANSNVKLTEYQYFDLIRTLKFELSSTFYKAYYQQESGKIYNQQIDALLVLLKANEQQVKMGNIAVKDVIRIKSLLYGLQSEYSKLMNDNEDLQTQIKLLTNIKPDVKLVLSNEPDQQSSDLDKQIYSNLLDSAKNNRADLKLALTEITSAENNLSLQKANAIPDVEFSMNYDYKGNYPDKYVGIGIKLPIPLFNRNQGQIKIARIAITAGKSTLNQQQVLLENEVYNAYTSAMRTETLYKSLDQNFSADFQKLIEEVIKNFKNRNISLIEFLDFYDSYKSNVLQMNELRYERMNARQEINYVTGSTIFK